METEVDKWINFLKPENLKGNLISCALFIAIYESLKDYIIEEVKSFYCNGFVDQEFTYSAEYRTDVLERNPSPFFATLYWLKDQGAINDNEIELVQKLKKYRNRLSHEMMQLVFDAAFDDFPENLSSLMALRIKIERWWVINIEIPTSPDIDSTIDINEESIQTSSQILYRVIMDILSGDEETANYYYREFSKKKMK